MKTLIENRTDNLRTMEKNPSMTELMAYYITIKTSIKHMKMLNKNSYGTLLNETDQIMKSDEDGHNDWGKLVRLPRQRCKEEELPPAASRASPKSKSKSKIKVKVFEEELLPPKSKSKSKSI